MEQNKAFLNFLLDRRSCRKFRAELPPRSALAAVAEAGRYAPSAKNRQLNRFYIITDPALLDSISRTVSDRLEGFAGHDCRYAAPALILVVNSRTNNCAIQDASCALENMMLAACAMWLGSCWINQPYFLRDDAVMQELLAPIGLTDADMICGSLAVGYPERDLFPGRLDHPGNPVFWVDGE